MSVLHMRIPFNAPSDCGNYPRERLLWVEGRRTTRLNYSFSVNIEIRLIPKMKRFTLNSEKIEAYGKWIIRKEKLSIMIDLSLDVNLSCSKLTSIMRAL